MLYVGNKVGNIGGKMPTVALLVFFFFFKSTVDAIHHYILPLLALLPSLPSLPSPPPSFSSFSTIHTYLGFCNPLTLSLTHLPTPSPHLTQPSFFWFWGAFVRLFIAISPNHEFTPLIIPTSLPTAKPKKRRQTNRPFITYNPAHCRIKAH